MIAFDMDAIRENCDEFFSLYNVTKAGTLEMCRRKREHTQHVADNCMYIAKHMGLNEYDCALAWAIGELHDFARFGQAVVTQTFVDSERFNHARLGARLLFTHRMIDDIITNYDEISDTDKIVMEKAVYHHSDYSLPEGLTERERLFCVIIRDADKTDIFRTCACGVWESVCNSYSREEILNSDISPEFVAAFREHRTADYKKRTLPADFHVAHIALCFGLETPSARRLAVEQGYLSRLMDNDFTRPEVQKKYEAMKAEVNKFMGI